MAQFAHLDLSVLDSLAELKTQRETLEHRLAAMEERRDEVAAPVYLRVRGDYEKQKAELVAQEKPLKDKARTLYAELREALERLERESESAKLSQQELEFRFSLGEFPQAEFDRRAGAINATLTARQSEHAEARALRERFLQAFASEAELNAQPESAPVGKARFTAQEVAGATAVVTPVTAPPIPPALPPIGPVTLGQATEQVVPVPPPVPPAETPAPKRANPDATVVFRPGRLLPQNNDAGDTAVMLSLKPIIIGADASCDVRISNAGAAAKQAEIALTRAGFMFKDISGGGVGMLTINDVPIAEQLLRDGDQLQIGTAKFLFKSG
jgi:hypothetical protein